MDTKPFVPRATCGEGFRGSPGLVATLIWTERIIAFCYWSIPFLGLMFYRRFETSGVIPRGESLAAGVMLFCFFVASCGLTHFTESVVYEIPLYRLDACVRFLTLANSLLFVGWASWELAKGK